MCGIELCGWCDVRREVCDSDVQLLIGLKCCVARCLSGSLSGTSCCYAQHLRTVGDFSLVQ